MRGTSHSPKRPSGSVPSALPVAGPGEPHMQEPCARRAWARCWFISEGESPSALNGRLPLHERPGGSQGNEPWMRRAGPCGDPDVQGRRRAGRLCGQLEGHHHSRVWAMWPPPEDPREVTAPEPQPLKPSPGPGDPGSPPTFLSNPSRGGGERNYRRREKQQGRHGGERQKRDKGRASIQNQVRGKKGEVWAGGASPAGAPAQGLLAGGLTSGLAAAATVPAQQDARSAREMLAGQALGTKWQGPHCLS